MRWTPAAGDRFSLISPAFEDDVFTLADMVVEPHGPPEARELGFNGTTEWALDSVDVTAALWMPREDQLRTLVGPFFRSLTLVDGRFAVTVELPGRAVETCAADCAEDAYALAVLARLAAAGFRAPGLV